MRYDGCVEVCTNLDRPGLATGDPLWVDHTGDETTVDQARIEEALVRMPLEGRAILHVGVGNSKFAQRFAGQVRLIDGITVSEAEKKLADSLGIPNYTVHLLNKYGRDFGARITNGYDYVVDNNLASFACCKFHFHRMLDNFISCMAPGGRILTDQRGMDWTVENDPRWALTYDDLVELGERFPFTASRVTDTVYELRV